LRNGRADFQTGFALMPIRRSVLFSVAAVPLFTRMVRAATLNPSGGDDTRALQAAINAVSGGVVQLGVGRFNVSTLTVDANTTMLGVPGATKLVSSNGQEIFKIGAADEVVLQGLGLTLKGDRGQNIRAKGVRHLVIENCSFSGGEAGLRLSACGGRVADNRFQFHDDVGLQSIDSTGLRISGNRLSDIGNSGIQVWQTEPREDSSIVTENHVSRIAAKSGGNGQNGNGINIFKAGNVTVSNNRISDCAFTGIRNNSGANSIITGNAISRCNEVALFVEFSHDGSVVADNIIDTASQGIEIVNFDVGGRLSQCTGNVVRNITGVDPEGLPLGGGIFCEADVIVANNLVDIAKSYGIRLGWGPYGRNLQASNNTLMDCPRGIEFSLAGEGPYVITNNIIRGAELGAVVGMDHLQPITADLTVPGSTLPTNLISSGNMAKS
jgi:uncharacterized secreted repeat protein (TIGR03808 family)